MKKISAIPFLALVLVSVLQARVDLLLVPPTAAVSGQPGVELTLYLNNPTETPEVTRLPNDLVASYATTKHRGRVRLALVDPQDINGKVGAMSRRTIVLRLAEPIPADPGFASLRLIDPETNAIMFEIAPAGSEIGGAVAAIPTAPNERRPIVPGPHLDLANDLENVRRHVSSYDPIYFAVGWRERLNARFQVSFKYRVFERGPPGEVWYRQLARDFHVAYTQTAIWDLETFSKPFYDSSYKPTAFLLHEFEADAASDWRLSLQGGAQHESNGKGGGSAPAVPRTGLLSSTTPLRHPSDSRSLNSLYLAPKVRWNGERGLFAEARAWGSAFFQTDENPDIARYRGHVELTLRGGYDRGFQVSAHARGQLSGHGSIELNLTWPAIETPLLKMVLPLSTGGYAQIQYFNGYGESLLDYDVRRKDQLRFGLMIVR